MRSRRWSTAVAVAAVAASALLAGEAGAAPVVFTDRALFLAAAGGGLGYESFEAPFASAPSVSFGGFAVTESNGSSNAVLQGTRPTDGSFSVASQNVTQLDFTFAPAVTAFGFDFHASNGAYTIRLGDLSTVAGVAGDGFFGVIDATDPFTDIRFDRTSAGLPTLDFDQVVFGLAATGPVGPGGPAGVPLPAAVWGGLALGGAVLIRRAGAAGGALAIR